MYRPFQVDYHDEWTIISKLTQWIVSYRLSDPLLLSDFLRVESRKKINRYLIRLSDPSDFNAA